MVCLSGAKKKKKNNNLTIRLNELYFLPISIYFILLLNTNYLYLVIIWFRFYIYKQLPNACYVKNEIEV